MRKKVAVVFGTRPEAIKMGPVILELNKHKDFFEPVVIVTAQHREMLDQVLKVFHITPDYDLNIMKKNQSLSDITTDVLKGIEGIFKKEQPDMVLVHGDTTTSFSAALAAYYQRIPVGHVEAGLRTYDHDNPFPEEGNRQLIDNLADLYFVPTKATEQNLLLENKKQSRIVVTGNTVIDAVHYIKNTRVEHRVLDLMKYKSDQKWIVLTMHRRENYGTPMKNVFKAVVDITEKNSNVEILMPVHLSPRVQALANEVLGNNDRIHLVEPLEVDVFHKVIDQAYLVLTDSGGLQEEAPTLNKPVLVLRNKTERPEGLEAGTLKLIGTETDSVYVHVSNLLTDKKEYIRMAEALNPYGDGTASAMIVKALKDFM
ncbi:UDP-N-acetylglucosamine 2-epimerase (non-hydrolyzing) [Alkalibacterium iburiense]|uniref:UDP-N-acetylglucosamine 2-epimerase (non-hydrolyzing) n=1 Tax=Alkalibacterium iburiense TaxID=290589 RepID=A0ABP3H1W6_9LACT